MLEQSLLISGTILPLVASVAYIISIARGVSVPHRMTRFLLLVITGLSWVSLLAAHDRTGVWLAFVSFVQSAVLWVLSWWRGIGGRDPLDLVCLALCGVGIGLWLALGESLVGLVTSIVVDAIALVPSIIKTYRLPHTESLAFYAIDTIAGLCVLLAGPLTGQAVLYPLYIMFANAVYMWLILRPRWVRRYTSADRPFGIVSDD